jgi:hypothetical protein
MRTGVCGGNLKVIDYESAYLEDLGIDRRSILKLIFIK